MEFQEIVYFKVKDGNNTLLLPFALMSGEKKELLMPWLSGYVTIPKGLTENRGGIPFFQHWGQGYADSLRAGDSVCGVTITHQAIQDFWKWHDIKVLPVVKFKWFKWVGNSQPFIVPGRTKGEVAPYFQKLEVDAANKYGHQPIEVVLDDIEQIKG